MFERMLHEIECNKDDYKFYSVNADEIIEAETKMGIKMPNSLKIFYKEIGYGFFKKRKNFVNRIMDPIDIACFMYGNEEYEYVDKSIYNLDGKIVFLNIQDEDFLTIDSGDQGKECIYYFGKVIANSLTEFIAKAMDDPNYYFGEPH